MTRIYSFFFILFTLCYSLSFSFSSHRVLLEKNFDFEIQEELLLNESHIYDLLYAYDVESKDKSTEYLNDLIEEEKIDYYEWIVKP